MELFDNYEIEEKIEEKKLANDTIEYNKFGFKFDPSKVLKFLLMTNINNIEYWYVLMTKEQRTNESILCYDEKINAWYSAFYEVRENHFLESVSDFNKLRAEALARMPKRIEFEGALRRQGLQFGYAGLILEGLEYSFNIRLSEKIDLKKFKQDYTKVTVTIEEVQE